MDGPQPEADMHEAAGHQASPQTERGRLGRRCRSGIGEGKRRGADSAERTNWRG